jgi:hypothetical protein
VRRKQRYLVGLRSTPGYALTASAQSDAFLDRLPQMDGVEIIRKLHSRRDAHSPAGSLNPTPDLIVVSMEEHRGEALRQHAPPHIIVEVDSPIGHSDLAPSEPAGWQFRARSMPFPKLRRDIQFCVLGEGDRPLANATINLFGPGFPTQGMTDAAGRTAVPVFTPDPADIQAVYARPAAGHWEKYIPSPALDAGGINLVRLTPFSKNTTKTALDRQHGWGQRMMKFDRMAADWSGVGVKVGIIDSGCDTTHPILRHIDRGVDFTRELEVGRARSRHSQCRHHRGGGNTHRRGGRLRSGRASLGAQGGARGVLQRLDRCAGCLYRTTLGYRPDWRVLRPILGARHTENGGRATARHRLHHGYRQLRRTCAISGQHSRHARGGRDRQAR